jgi:hypothetical protein
MMPQHLALRRPQEIHRSLAHPLQAILDIRWKTLINPQRLLPFIFCQFHITSSQDILW